MTVTQLIKRLKSRPGNEEVILRAHDHSHYELVGATGSVYGALVGNDVKGSPMEPYINQSVTVIQV